MHAERFYYCSSLEELASKGDKVVTQVLDVWNGRGMSIFFEIVGDLMEFPVVEEEVDHFGEDGQHIDLCEKQSGVGADFDALQECGCGVYLAHGVH